LVPWTSFEVRTSRRAQLADITEKVAALVAGSGVEEGVCHVYVPHTTAGVTINEGADPDVAHDIEMQLARLVPKDGGFEHGEGNSDSHIKTALVGPAVAAPVRGGKLALGTWQAIFLCEWDGPRTRKVEVAVSRV
jgi:secondary thiamine-phosphate synthase enzyme